MRTLTIAFWLLLDIPDDTDPVVPLFKKASKTLFLSDFDLPFRQILTPL